MSRYERDVMHEGLCPCGAGTTEVVHVTPGGPYGKASWEKALRCEVCSAQYELHHDELLSLGRKFEVWFVRKDDSSGTRISALSKNWRAAATRAPSRGLGLVLPAFGAWPSAENSAVS